MWVRTTFSPFSFPSAEKQDNRKCFKLSWFMGLCGAFSCKTTTFNYNPRSNYLFYYSSFTIVLPLAFNHIYENYKIS